MISRKSSRFKALILHGRLTSNGILNDPKDQILSELCEAEHGNSIEDSLNSRRVFSDFFHGQPWRHSCFQSAADASIDAWKQSKLLMSTASSLILPPKSKIEMSVSTVSRLRRNGFPSPYSTDCTVKYDVHDLLDCTKYTFSQECLTCVVSKMYITTCTPVGLRNQMMVLRDKRVWKTGDKD